MISSILMLLLASLSISQEQKVELAKEAAIAAKSAYAPYSHYAVGCALLAVDGAIVHGANVENSSYGLTCCAERVALFTAITGGKREIAALAVATRDGGSPCGACRQVINEFHADMPIVIANLEGEIVSECTLSELLPRAFGPQNLKP